VWTTKFFYLLKCEGWTLLDNNFLHIKTGVSVRFTHAGNFIWHGGCQMSRMLYSGTLGWCNFTTMNPIKKIPKYLKQPGGASDLNSVSLTIHLGMELNIYEPRHDKTYIMGLRPAWIQTSLQSDQDPCCSLSDSLLVIGFVSQQHGSWYQTVRMRRLIWIHAGRKPIMLVLSWRGSYIALYAS
jgi:hypothetical protein